MTFTAIEPAEFPWFDYSRYTFSLGLARGPHYLSGHSASEYDREERSIVVRGDLAQQTRTAYAKIERILSAHGLDFGDVVRLVENVTVAGIDDYLAAEAVRGEVFGDHRPVVSTVCVERLLRPAALIEIEVVAGPADGPITAASSPRVAWTPARGMAGIVYLSSCLPLDDEGQLVGEGDLVAQAQRVYAVARERLTALGLGMENIAKTVDYLHPDGLADHRKGAPRAPQRTLPDSDGHPHAAGLTRPRRADPAGRPRVP